MLPDHSCVSRRHICDHDSPHGSASPNTCHTLTWQHSMETRCMGGILEQAHGRCSPSSAASVGTRLGETLGPGHSLHAHAAARFHEHVLGLHFTHEAPGLRSPGSTALTRTPFGASSKARFFVSASWAALATLYAGFPPRGIWEPIDPMFTTAPCMHACPGSAATAEKFKQQPASRGEALQGETCPPLQLHRSPVGGTT